MKGAGLKALVNGADSVHVCLFYLCMIVIGTVLSLRSSVLASLVALLLLV